MTFKLNLAPLVAHVVSSAADAEMLAGKAVTCIQVVEQMAVALGLKGPDKLELVRTMLLADLTQVNPGLAKTVTAAWPQVAGFIGVAVAIFNAFKWAFEAVAPIIVAAAPGAGTAVAAIAAVTAAVTAVGNAVDQANH